MVVGGAVTARGGGCGRQHSRQKEKYVQRPGKQREHVCVETLRGVRLGWNLHRAVRGVWREGSGWSWRALHTMKWGEFGRRAGLWGEEFSFWICGNVGR